MNTLLRIVDLAPDILEDIRYYSTYNFVGKRICGYEAPFALLTEKAVLQLKKVSDELICQGFRLKIFDAYRPQRAVNHFLSWIDDETDLKMKEFFYPDLLKKDIIPRGYLFAKSSHSRGSTVDATLFDMNKGLDVDMGGPFDFFSKRSHLDYQGLTKEQFQNRNLLQKTMTKYGFKTIDTEWWHFTLIDEPYPETYFDFPITNSP